MWEGGFLLSLWDRTCQMRLANREAVVCRLRTESGSKYKKYNLTTKLAVNMYVWFYRKLTHIQDNYFDTTVYIQQ